MFSFRNLVVGTLIVSTSALAREHCKTLHIFVTLASGKKCDSVMGHVGVGVGENYYDWGPASRKTRWRMVLESVYGGSGRPYDALNEVHPGDKEKYASSSEIRSFLKGQRPEVEAGYLDDYNECEAYEATAQVTRREAQLQEYFWEWTYKNAPYFHVAKNQCTNTAYGSLLYSKLLKPKGIFPFQKVILVPGLLLKRIQADLTNTCGKTKGKPAKIVRLQDGGNEQPYLHLL